MKKIVAFLTALVMIASIFVVANSSGNFSDDTTALHNGTEKEKTVEIAKYDSGNDVYNVAETHSFAGEPRGFRILPRMFEAHIHTKCDTVEKDTSILYGLLLPIDVDNNPGTGQNGNDIKVRFYVLPSFYHEDFGWVMSLSAVVEVERLGEEMKDKDFEIYLDVRLSLENYDYGTHEFRLGYSSPEGKELPSNERVTFTVYPYLMYDRNPDFILQNTPIFDGEVSDVDVVASYSGSFGGNTFDHSVAVSFQPAVSSTIKFTPDMNLQKINMDISRSAERDTTLTISYSGETNGEGMDLALTIDKIPAEMAFSVSYSIFGPSGERGTVDYESSSEFNVTMTVKMGRIGLMGCTRVQYLPTHLRAEWTNHIYDGHVNVSTSSSLTEFMVCDDLENPGIYLSVSNITNSANFSWNMDQGGYVKLDAEKEGPKLDFYGIMGSMRAEVISQLKTDYLFISWNIDQQGYVVLDTHGNWLNTFSLNFTLDDNIGLLIGASLLRADNFRTDWVVWPPSFQLSGDLTFVGDMVFSVMVGGTWYSLPL